MLESACSLWYAFALCFTLLLQVALTVLSPSGFCASGGPYEIAVEWPAAVAAFAPLGIFGGLAQALVESVLRFGIGTRVWITEIMQRDGVDATAALFSESTARMLVSVPREDDVKFQSVCEVRGVPFLRIGVTENSGALEVQDEFTLGVQELRAVHRGVLRAAFGR